MDPTSVVGLLAAIQQLLSCVYKFGQGLYEAKREINLLCSELLALKAALEHVQLNFQLESATDHDSAEDAQRILASSNFATPEFQKMLVFTDDILTQLQAKLDKKPGTFRSSLRILEWPMVKNEVSLYIARLERSKRWFILATTSDNL